MISDIPLNLPTIPLTTDPELYKELVKIYNAFQVLQLELSAAKKRISALESYNVAHP